MAHDLLNDNFAADSDIRNYYENKTVFITGGTGYLGSLLIHKLLRCSVKEIIILVREKKTKSVKERLNDLFARPIFETLKENIDKYKNQITIVEGDLQYLKVGLSEESENIIKDRVEIIFHAAADVRFDETLKLAVETNVRGTREILDLAVQVKNLEVFVYVSTAYSNCGRSHIEEKIYSPPVDPRKMIQLVEQITDFEPLNVLTERIIHPWPNTYAYTKVLAEDLIRQYGRKLKIGLIRPSIVVNTYTDPIPGYTDNVYGVNGVVTGVALGILRIVYIDNSFLADIVPADLVVNATMGVAWDTATERQTKQTEKSDAADISADDETIRIYNNTAYPDNPITWGDIKDKINRFGIHYPVLQSLWIATYNTTKYYTLSEILKIVYHIIPAIFFDAYLAMKGEKKMILHLYRKIHKFAKVISFFTNNQWQFENDNMRELCERLSDRDRQLFAMDIQKLDWDAFFPVYILGLRKYIGKESLDNLEKAKSRNRKLKIMHYSFLFIVYGLLCYGLLKIAEFYDLNILSSQSYFQREII